MLKSIAQRTVKAGAVAYDRLRPPGRGVVVLLYHRVGARTASSVDLPESLFDEQISMLAAAQRAETLPTALDRLDSAEVPAVDPVVVTFDDGTADFVDVALPILVRYRVPAVLYLATEFVDRRRAFPGGGVPVSWSALADALATGFVTVGSHTHTHALLDRLPESRVEAELDRSRERIGEQLGVAAEHFAYPKARPGSPSADRAVRRRFASAALGGMRPNPYGRTDRYRLARFSIQTGDGVRYFERKLAGGMRLEGALRDTIDRARYARAST